MIVENKWEKLWNSY